ncbi:ak1, partial [Symbiodinium pilosum]
ERAGAVVYDAARRKLSVPGAGRVEVEAAIASQWSIAKEEQLLFQESAAEVGTVFYRLERKMNAKKIRFTQSSISPVFRNGQPIFKLLNDLNARA